MRENLEGEAKKKNPNHKVFMLKKIMNCKNFIPGIYGLVADVFYGRLFRLSPLSTSGGEECTICFKEESTFPELSIKCSTHQRHNVCKQCLYTYFKQEIDEGWNFLSIKCSQKYI